MLKRIALFVAVTVAGIAVARGEEWNKTFAVSGPAELRVDAKDGAVVVRTGDGKSISARVIATGWKIGPGELDVREHQTGNRVDLELRLPSRQFDFGRRSIRVEVNVPRETRLDIRTGDGSIHVTDTTGEIRLTTGDGSIEASGVEGSVTARTGDGRISIRGRVQGLNLHTGDGSISADLLPGSEVATSWRVETGDGSITMRLPRELSAVLDAHTGDGSIKVDLPMAEEQKGGNSVRAKLGAGGRTFTVRTQDGSVRISPI
jgi:hypothetical protein